MSTYICRNCEVEIRITNRMGTRSVYADVCPVCQNEDGLEYL